MTGRTIAFTIDADNKRYSLTVDGGSDYQVAVFHPPFSGWKSAVLASTALCHGYSNSLDKLRKQPLLSISSIGGDSW